MSISSDTFTAQNKNLWNRVYETSDRLRYPDLMYMHFLMKYALKNDRVQIAHGIDVGAGDGPQAFATARLGIKMVTADISEESLARLKKFSAEEGLSELVQVHQTDQRDLSAFADKSFDLAVSWSVISYGSFEDGRKAVSEIARVLKPGGSFIGLIESLEHDGYRQEGTVQLSEKTYRLPAKVKFAKPDVILTYYDKADVLKVLSHEFEDVALSHRVLEVPPRCEGRVGQWMFHCRKK